jgi:hypothetical protein
MNPGGKRGGKAAAPANKKIAVIKPVAELEDRKRVKSIATAQRALAYERRNGAVSEDAVVRKLQGRIQALSKEALVAASSKAGGSGSRISFRSKGDAARNYRARAGQTSYVANQARFGGMTLARAGNGAGNGALYRRATAAQPNFLTGGTDKISGRLQPAGQRKVKRRSKPY